MPSRSLPSIEAEGQMAFILVAEDLPYLRTLIRRILESAGHEVAVTADGREALCVYRDRPADVVLCDVFMPVMDGLETLRELRREFPGVRVVGMSGGGIGGRDVLPDALALGAVNVITKPFSPVDLVAVIAAALPPAAAAPG
jgi:CheY-like chemotaxis protein